MLPILQLLADGQPRRISDLRDELARQFDISDADRSELLPSGRSRLFDNRVSWARTDLGMAGAVRKAARGSIQITDRGKAILAEGLHRLDRKMLARYPEFEAFTKRRSVKPDEPVSHTDNGSGVESADSSHLPSGREDSATLPPLQKQAQAMEAVSETLTFTDAAAIVLEQYAAKQPMHYRAITRKVLELGLIRTEGQTPEATLRVRISEEIARQTQRGDAPRFTQHGKGTIGLSCWTTGSLADRIDRHNWEARQRLLAHLLSISPADFEALFGQLLEALGFQDVLVTGRSGDGGIDVRGTLVVGEVIRTRMAVQVKRWKANVQAPIVQQVRGSLGTHDQGLIITTSDFSTGARAEAERPNAVPVALMHGEQLVRLLVEHEIGVRRVPYDLIELSTTVEPGSEVVTTHVRRLAGEVAS